MTGGEITLDGVDIRKYSRKDLRESIGFVPQKGILFSGTIASNLRFGAKDATDEQIREAAEIAQASEFIEEKEDGYQSAAPLPRAEATYPAGRSRDLPLQEPLQKIRRFMSSMTAFLRWI